MEVRAVRVIRLSVIRRPNSKARSRACASLSFQYAVGSALTSARRVVTLRTSWVRVRWRRVCRAAARARRSRLQGHEARGVDRGRRAHATRSCRKGGGAALRG